MGFMDGFTSDGTVDMKHTEYYNLMKEAAKAELVCNANIRRNVWRVAGSVKGAKRNPVARWGTKTTGLELNTHIITQDIEEIKRFFLYIGRKAAIMAIRIISAAAGAAILILAALGFFAYAVMAKAWNELFD